MSDDGGQECCCLDDIDDEIKNFFEDEKSDKDKDLKNKTIKTTNVDSPINEKENIKSECEEKFKKNNSNKKSFDEASISLNTNEKLDNDIEIKDVNVDIKKENEIKNIEKNKEDSNIINKDIILNNKKIEENENNKISKNDMLDKNDNEFFKKINEDSYDENKINILKENILEKKDINEIKTKNTVDICIGKVSKSPEANILAQNSENNNIINENNKLPQNSEDNNIINKNNILSQNNENNNIINEFTILPQNSENNNTINENNKLPQNNENNNIINEFTILSQNSEDNNIINKNNILPQNNEGNIIISNKYETLPQNNINNINNIDEDLKKDNKNIDQPAKKDEFIKTTLYKRDELYVNLIHFDYKLTNKENYLYYNNFKVDVVGGYHAIDDLVILKNHLESLKKKEIPFIVLASGSSGKDIIPICQKYSFIKEVIIFCFNYKYNEHYLREYPGYIKKVLTSIKAVYDYIKTFGEENSKKEVEKYKYIFSAEEIQINKQLKQCPVITAIEYNRCAYLVHKVYSHFFGDINNEKEKPIFGENNFNKIIDCLDKIDFEKNEKEKLLQKFKYLFSLKDNESFVEESIRAYTGESSFCYLFNRMMRNFEKGLISFGYYMGPLLYCLNKYVKENNKFAILKSKKLYRIIECSKLDFYLYKINLGHIICFPSLTSTSSKEIIFKPTNLSKNININNDVNEKVKIKMIFEYKYKKGNISPGIIIENNKGKDGTYLSKYYNTEKEVILFPFTFARIKEIKEKKEKGIKFQRIKLEIINRTSYIEYLLKNDEKFQIED